MNDKIIDEEIERINRALSQEGMPLTEDDKNTLKDIYTGKSTYDKTRNQIIKESLEKNKGIDSNDRVSKIR